MYRFLSKKRGIVALTILVGILFLPSAPLLITAGITILAGRTYPAAVRPLKNAKFWVVIGLLVLIVPLFSGPQDRSWWGLTYSHAMIMKTGLMALRGVSVFLFLQVLTVDLNSESVNRVLDRFGSPNFALLYQLSREILPKTRDILQRRMTRDIAFHPRLLFQGLKYIFQDLIQLADTLAATDSQQTPPDPKTLPDLVTPPALVIVTGASGTGKTTWLTALRDHLRDRSLPVGGLLTLRHPGPGDGHILRLHCLSSGESRELASTEQQTNAIATKHYFFRPDVLQWGAERLQSAQEPWVMVDEVGIFEFHGQGFFPALKIMDNCYHGILVLALRKSLVAELDGFLKEHLPQMHRWERYYITVDEASSKRNE